MTELRNNAKRLVTDQARCRKASVFEIRRRYVLFLALALIDYRRPAGQTVSLRDGFGRTAALATLLEMRCRTQNDGRYL